MRTHIALTLLVTTATVTVACGGSVFPPAVIPVSPTSEDWPDAGAAVIEDEATLEIHAVTSGDGRSAQITAVLDHRRRLKILNEAGLAAATVELPVDAFSTVRNAYGRSVGPDGSIVDMRGDQAQEVSPSGVAQGTPVKSLRLNIPGAKVGGLVEYRYQRAFSDALWVPVWLFGGPYPVVRTELSIVADPGIEIDYRFGRGDTVQELLPLRRPLGDGRERLAFVLRDLPAYYDEPQMPHRAHRVPWLAVTVTAARLAAGTRRMQTWEGLALHLQAFLDMVGGAPGSGTPAARFRALRGALKPIGLSGVGVLAPTSGARLMTNAPACNRDAAALLLGALKNSGAEASPALVASASSPPVLADLPSLAPFARVVVAVRANGAAADRSTCSGAATELDPVCRTPEGGYLFLDASCSTCRYGELPWELASGRVVVLSANGVERVDIPPDPPEQHRLRLSYVLALDSSGKVTGSFEGEATGNAATRLRALRSDGGGSLDARVGVALFGANAVPQLKEVTLEGASVEVPVGLKGKVVTGLQKLAYQRYRLRPYDLVGPAVPGTWRKSRRYDAVLEAPQAIEQVFTLELPVGYEVSLPAQVRINESFAEYAAGFERRERTLSYTRRVRLKSHLIRAEEWEAFRAFLERIEQEEERGARIWAPE